MNCVDPTGTNNPNNAKPRSLKIPRAYNEVGPPSTVDLHYNKGVERVTHVLTVFPEERVNTET